MNPDKLALTEKNTWRTLDQNEFTIPITGWLDNARALKLELTSNKATWLSVDVHLDCPDPMNGYKASILIEWEGTNTIYLRCRSFTAYGQPESMDQTKQIRLVAGCEAFPGTILEIGRAVWVKDIPPTRLNQNEILLENFMGPEFWDNTEWERESNLPEEDTEFFQNWIWAVLSYIVRAGRKNDVSYSKKYNVSITDYQAMTISISCDRRTDFTLEADIDGQPLVLIDRRKGIGDREDIRVEIHGSTLNSLRLKIAEPGTAAGADQGQKISATISWIMLERKGTDPARPAEIVGIEKILPSEYYDDFAEKGMPLGLILDKDEVKAISKKIHQESVPAKIYEQIIGQVITYRDIEPEPYVGEFSPVNYTNYGLGRVGAPELPMHTAMVYSGLAYALEQKIEYGQIARRFLLSQCRCKHWSVGFITRLPVGIEGYRHPLADAPMTISVCLCYDLIYNLLSPAERLEVENAVFTKAIPVLVSFLRRKDGTEFMRSNMGMYYATALMYAILVAERSHKEAALFMNENMDRLQKLLVNCYNTDGSAVEGIGYWAMTTNCAIESIILMSKHTKKSIQEIMPENFIKSIDFILHLNSLAAKKPDFINFADGCRSEKEHYSYGFAGTGILFFAHYLEHEGARWLWNQKFAEHGLTKECLFGASNGIHSNIALMYLKLYQDKPAAPPLLPEWKLFETCEKILIRTGVKYGDMQLMFEGGEYASFHAHFDKGQFVLEAYGERLISDAGMISYYDPGSIFFVNTPYHNVLTINGKNQSYKPGEKAVRLKITENRPNYKYIFADLSGSYEDLNRYTRRILYVQPDYFLIIDEVDSKNGGMEWNFHSDGQFSCQNGIALAACLQAGLILCSSEEGMDCQMTSYKDENGNIACHNLIMKPDSAIKNLSVAYLMLPYPENGGEKPVVRRNRLPGGVEFTVEGAHMQDIVLCRLGADPLVYGKKEIFERIVVMRNSKNGEEIIAIQE